jgi:nucleoside-diphosphate kinase
MEQTLVLVKPDGVKKNLIGEVISRFEGRGLKVAALKLVKLTDAQAKYHYAEHQEKPFFGELIAFITSGPVAAMVIEGENAIKAVRGMMGATNPLEAVPGSIRGDFALTIGENIVHGSDSTESAAREIKNYFSTEEIY